MSGIRILLRVRLGPVWLPVLPSPSCYDASGWLVLIAGVLGDPWEVKDVVVLLAVVECVYYYYEVCLSLLLL